MCTYARTHITKTIKSCSFLSFYFLLYFLSSQISYHIMHSIICTHIYSFTLVHIHQTLRSNFKTNSFFEIIEISLVLYNLDFIQVKSSILYTVIVVYYVYVCVCVLYRQPVSCIVNCKHCLSRQLFNQTSVRISF